MNIVCVFFLVVLSSILISACVDVSGSFCIINRLRCRNANYEKKMRQFCRNTCNLCNTTLPNNTNIITDAPNKSTPQNITTTSKTTMTSPPGSELHSDCGWRTSTTNTFVIGGNDSNPWPWQANVNYKYFLKQGHYCGGTLISDEWVVSAAHCFSDIPIKEWYTVTLGEYNLRIISGTEQKFQITQIIIHPRFNKITLDYDIALLRLRTKVLFNQYIHPVCLPDDTIDFAYETICHVSGWGTINPFNVVPNVLQEGKVPLAPFDACNATYSRMKYRRRGYKMSNRMLCTGTVNGTVDPCNGDSGGPLLCKKTYKSRDIWYLWGVISWGDGCAKRGLYNVYTNVKMLRNWIVGVAFSSHKKVVT